MTVWDPSLPLGGNDVETIKRARVLLWRGHCSVHQMFTPAHVEFFRKHNPEIRILVHPECPMEVVDRADIIGSTESIINTIENHPPVRNGQSERNSTLSTVSRARTQTRKFISSLQWFVCARRCIGSTCRTFVGPWRISVRVAWSIRSRFPKTRGSGH